MIFEVQSGTRVEAHVTGTVQEVAREVKQYLRAFPPAAYGTWEVRRYPRKGGAAALISRHT